MHRYMTAEEVSQAPDKLAFAFFGRLGNFLVAVRALVCPRRYVDFRGVFLTLGERNFTETTLSMVANLRLFSFSNFELGVVP